jgi:hypothetical protein
MPFDQGAPQFGIRDCKIATWSSAGSYGTVTDVMSIQMMGVTMQQTSAQLEGDDEITATAARAIGGQAQMRFGGLNLDSLAVMLGIAVTTISSVDQIQIAGGDVMPYFGTIGKYNAEEGGGDTWAFLPKGKIVSDFTLIQGEYGSFAIPEVTVQLVSDASYGVINIITHPTALDITVMPPANIAAIS